MITSTEPLALTEAVKSFISSAVKLAVIIGLLAVDQFQLAAIMLFVDNGLALGGLIWSRRQVFTKQTTQAIANQATFQEAGSHVDIGVPPDASPPLPPATPEEDIP